MSTAQVVSENGLQVIRLPNEIQLENGEISIKRVGHAFLLIPRGSDPWKMFTDSLSQFTDDYMQDRAQPAAQEREPLSE